MSQGPANAEGTIKGEEMGASGKAGQMKVEAVKKVAVPLQQEKKARKKGRRDV